MNNNFLPNADSVGIFRLTTNGSTTVTSVNMKTGDVVLGKSDVGLSQVDNTSDSNKNVLSATKWTTARTFNFIGGATGSASIDGSSDLNITMTVDLSSCLKVDDIRIPFWNDAATNSHNHSNKAVLDGTTASYTTTDKSNLDTAYTNSHNHINKSVLDATTASYTTLDKSNLDTAYNQSHTHSNKAVLDGTTASYTTTDKSNLNTAYTQSHTHNNKSVLDGTTASYTVADQTKLQGLTQTNIIQLTQAQYDALSDAVKLADNTLYVIVG